MDPGAVSNGLREADLTASLRDAIAVECNLLGAIIATDKDTESLKGYLQRIKPGDGSVVCDLHFNAGVPTATGVECIVKKGASAGEISLATKICKVICGATGLVNRGVKDETQSHRGRLGILHTPAGFAVLVEVCFLTNPNDLRLYNRGKVAIAKAVAKLLVEYDALR